jgi:hypothetical protein
MEKLSVNDMVFLAGHRGGASPKENLVMLELSIAATPEEAAAGKSQPLLVAIPADYAEKIIGSIQQSLTALRLAIAARAFTAASVA